MLDNEYPGSVLCFSWHVNETIAALGSIFSPVFELDRRQTVRSGSVAPTGATASGDKAHGFRSYMIGNHVLADLFPTGAAVNGSFQILGGVAENVNPLATVLETTAMVTAASFLHERKIGFAYVQFKIENSDAVTTLPVTGAVRIFRI